MLYLSKLALFLADASPSGTGEEVQELDPIVSGLITFGPMVLIVVAFYFFMLRPESKRKKEAIKMRNELIVGDEITTIGGIVGKVVSIKDDTVTIETGAEKARIQIMKWAVSNKGTKETS